eukprot:gnl/MRDRNA2_/MRDRNA2_106884_c0_seq1.p1 gnl/MRDRNA2_/MRDRNA2_106884_c0~~gnl/MRDRNA2_/MRDRNA2_106884_c0_seq1.p1  ORF type:complete len:313 (+),score=31.29 gnl/MRDRNA2_/MRDRNA2_106884_c0_seq1:108-1046(+)
MLHATRFVVVYIFTIPLSVDAQAIRSGSLAHLRVSESSRLSAPLNSRTGPQANPEHTTAFNRYPKIWTALTKLLEGRPNPKLLSFGCSDGSEARTLRMYMPNSEVNGVDINATLIEENNAKNTDPSIHYFSDVEPLQKVQHDAVTVMNVLLACPCTPCKGGCSHMKPGEKPRALPFEIFEELTQLMDSMLAPGGYMVMYAANYRFEDAAVAKWYTRVSPRLESGYIPKFNRDGELISTGCEVKDDKIRNIAQKTGNYVDVGSGAMYGCNGDDYPWVFFQKHGKVPHGGSNLYSVALSTWSVAFVLSGLILEL